MPCQGTAGESDMCSRLTNVPLPTAAVARRAGGNGIKLLLEQESLQPVDPCQYPSHHNLHSLLQLRWQLPLQVFPHLIRIVSCAEVANDYRFISE